MVIDLVSSLIMEGEECEVAVGDELVKNGGSGGCHVLVGVDEISFELVLVN